MAPDDVPADDMHLFGLTRDPLDAALRGESDDPAVDALVRDLRAAYLPEGTRPRSAALAAFAGTGDDVPVEAAARTTSRPVEPVARPAVPLGRRVAVGVAAFAATMTGKVVLGGAVAAATLGGLHASEVVDVPLLPRAPAPRADTVPSTVPDAVDAGDPTAPLIVPPADGRAADSVTPGTDRDMPSRVDPAPSVAVGGGSGAPAPSPEAGPSDPGPVARPAPTPPAAGTEPPPTTGRPPAAQPPADPPATEPQRSDPGPDRAPVPEPQAPTDRSAAPTEQSRTPAPAVDEQTTSARP